MKAEELSPLIIENSLGCILTCWVQPKSSQDVIAGIHGDAVKIAITAPPVDGKANTHLCKFLAKKLGVPKSAVTLVSGQTSRSKVLQVAGLNKAGLLNRLLS